MASSKKQVSVAELYVEVMHTRGNISQFETGTTEFAEKFSGNSTAFDAVFDVWTLRRWPLDTWKLAASIEREAPELSKYPDNARLYLWYVTRHPDLESGIDSTYHPSVSSDKIDIERVKALLNG